MAALSLYDFAVPNLTRALKGLSAIIAKAREHSTLKDADLTKLRLVDDMHAFPFQVQTACNTAKFLCIRVAGVKFPAEEDNETTYEQLQARLASTVKLLETVKREDFEGKESAPVEYRNMQFTGLTYMTGFALPNFYFHVVTAYGILRGQGLDIGKMDYLGVPKSAPQ